jgi:phosphatidylinositol alpha-1,6-mannosyltransferase
VRPPELLLVSAGLGLEGGGRALAGRLLASACASFALAEGLYLRLFSLNGLPPALPSGIQEARDFRGRQAELALEVFRSQAGAAPPRLALFDLLGPARVQALVPFAWRSPYLVQLLGIEVWRPLSWDRARSLANARGILSISAHTLARAAPFCPDLPEARVIPLALEERGASGELDGGLLDRLGSFFFLMTGRMAASERYKGHDEVLEALPRLLSLRPEARLVIAGDGDDWPRLERRALELGVLDRVDFTGFTSEATLRELYRRSAALVLPSRGEGFGLVYLEAMREGRPVVAARASAAEEIVVDGETGLLVEPEDREALIDALAGLLAAPERARTLGEAGHRRWREEFSYSRYESRIHEALTSALRPEGAAP